MDLSVLDIIVYVIAGVLTLLKVGDWLIKKKVDVIAGKSATLLEKIHTLMDSGAVIVRGAGAEKLADVIEEAADIPDALGDVASKIEQITKNQDFTKERVLELIQEGKEVAVEGKDFWLKVIKKSV